MEKPGNWETGALEAVGATCKNSLQVGTMNLGLAVNNPKVWTLACPFCGSIAGCLQETEQKLFNL